MIAIGSRYWTVGCTVIYMLCLGVNETAGSYCDTHYCGPFEPDFLLEQVAKPITTQNSASVEKCKYIVKQNDDIISSLKQHDGQPCLFGDGPLCVYPCRCTTGCDKTSGACLRGGQCMPGSPQEFPWYGPACQIGNIAFGKNAVQPDDFGWMARKAVDGNTNPNAAIGGSCSTQASVSVPRAYWYVDLTERHVVLEVTVYVSDKEPELLKDFNVGLTTLNDSLHQMQNYIFCAHNTQTITASGSVTLRCLRPLVARKVAIFNSGPKMTICEVVVIGYLYSGNQVNRCRDGRNCPMPCRCTKGCDARTGGCLRDGKCQAGKIVNWIDDYVGSCQFGNIAYGKHATMAEEQTLSKRYTADKAVDGEMILNTSISHCAVASVSNSARPTWFRVDLGAIHAVRCVIVFNSYDDSYARMHKFVIRAGMSPDLNQNEILFTYDGAVPKGGAASRCCDSFPLPARYVTLQQLYQNFITVFSLCEFAVTGYQLPATPLRIPLLAPHDRKPPRDCTDLADNGFWKSGVYQIYTGSDYRPILVSCDMNVRQDGGAWTVIMRRKEGRANFDRTWNEYASGFGNLSGEFWLGNEFIHKMTAMRLYQVRVTLELPNNIYKSIIYDKFRIGSNITNYRLDVGLARTEPVRDVDCFTGNGLDYKGTINRSKSGRICKEWTDQSAKCAGALKQSKTDAKNYCRSTNATGCQKRRPYCYVTDPDKTWEYCSVPKCVDKFAGDGLSALNSYAFSTNDKKTTDARAKTGCPADRGGWWHGAECSGANLNGKFLKTGAPTDSHIQWRTATTGPLMSVSIMIRPIG